MKEFLDPSVRTVEQALLARAAYLEAEAQHQPGMTEAEVAARKWLAQEFRALAEELSGQ